MKIYGPQVILKYTKMLNKVLKMQRTYNLSFDSLLFNRFQNLNRSCLIFLLQMPLTLIKILYIVIFCCSMLHEKYHILFSYLITLALFRIVYFLERNQLNIFIYFFAFLHPGIQINYHSNFEVKIKLENILPNQARPR